MGISQLVEALRFVFRPDFWTMAVFWTACLVFSYLQLLLPTLFASISRRYPRCSPASASSSPDRFRPLCIITGATSGLGAAAAYSLSKAGFYVVLGVKFPCHADSVDVGRSSELLSKTMREIKNRNEHALLKAFHVDVSSYLSLSKFKVSFEQWLLDSDLHASVQLLINNAGILATSHRLTSEGYDEMMATNYIGAFCLTKLLLPLLKNSPIPSRIVNVSSFTHRNVFNVQVNKDIVSGKCFSRSKQYPCARIYEYSKLCLLLFSYELHRQLSLNNETSQISVTAADPGAVQTNIMREVPSHISHIAITVLKLLGLLQSPENGVSSILDAALAPPEISGVYFFGGKGRTFNSSEVSRNTRLARELWTISSDLVLQSQLAVKEGKDFIS